MSVLLNGTNQFLGVSANYTMTNGLTIIASVYLSQLASATWENTILARGYNNANGSTNYIIRTYGSSLTFVFKKSDHTSWTQFFTSHKLSMHEWYNICFTHSYGNSASTVFYLNGSAVSGFWNLGNGDESPYTANAWDNSIGAFQSPSPSQYFKGQIERVMLIGSCINAMDARAITNGARWQDTTINPTDIKMNFPLGCGSGAGASGFTNLVPNGKSATVNAPVMGSAGPPLPPQGTPRWPTMAVASVNGPPAVGGTTGTLKQPQGNIGGSFTGTLTFIG